MGITIPAEDDPRRLRHVEIEGHTLITWDTYKHASTGQCLIGYAFTPKGATEPLFVGEDCGVAPSDPIDSDAACWGLLAFLTLKPGDTDREYFEGYTPDQLAWADSSECEYLGSLVYDFENADQLVEEHEDFVLPTFRDLDDREPAED